MAKLTKILGSGCGVKELESCPSAFHIELTQDELHELILFPDATAKRLGLEGSVRNVQVLTDAETDAETVFGRIDRPIYCCIEYKDVLLCRACPKVTRRSKGWSHGGR